MKISTVVNKVENGAIVDITLKVHEGDMVLMTADCCIDNATAQVKISKIDSNSINECRLMIENELKSKGIEKIIYQ